MSATPVTYQPRPGTTVYRLLAVLEQHGGEMTAAQLAEATGVDAHAIVNHLGAALGHGLVSRRQRDATHRKSPFWWRWGPQPPASTGRISPAPAEVRKQDSATGASTAIRARAAGMEAPPSAGDASTLPAGSSTHNREAAAPGDRPQGNGAGAPPMELSALRGIAVESSRNRWQAKPSAQPSPLRCALWSDGELHIVRGAAEPITFSRDETRELVRYLDSISLEVAA